MSKNNILVKNEYEANHFSANVMLATIIFVALCFVLEVIGIFKVPLKTMSIALFIATVLLLIPSIIVYVLKLEGWWIKYVIVSAAAIMVSFLNMFLAHHVVILYIFAIAIASLYFSPRLSWYAVLFSIVVLSVSQIFSMYTEGIRDKNFDGLFATMVYGVIPRGIELLALSLIFIALTKRTQKMLENVMGAEEQKEMFERMSIITNKSMDVSNVLVESVRQLSEITDQTLQANEKITKNTGNVVVGSQNTFDFVDEAANAAESISSYLNMIAAESKLMSDISDNVKQMTKNNGIVMKDSVDEMCAIAKVTSESKEIINKLEERTGEIERIIDLIKSISSQTNLLALNAAIESARAGEQGKGFAVVAEEIRKLAQQSEKAAKEIEDLIKQVTQDTKKAVDSIDNSSNMVDKGLILISEAGQCFKEVSNAGKEMNDKAGQVNSVTQDAAKNGDKIVSIVHNIRDINSGSIEELYSIVASSEQQLASMQQVTSSVDDIKRISGELLEIVR